MSAAPPQLEQTKTACLFLFGFSRANFILSVPGETNSIIKIINPDSKTNSSPQEGAKKTYIKMLSFDDVENLFGKFHCCI